ncbi:MAG: prepilin-type N-terminal cleavage/methylation domain-containing protein [Verrucomicrobia bacterium]|nr:prepilin-type N-terminal cleavage/methylation domain-containing protein [Verrucomicrobiota bacterium]
MRASGFSLIEVMIVVWIIGLLAAIAIPNFLKARDSTHRNLCIENLAQIFAAKQQWGLETGKSEEDEPSWDDLVGEEKWMKRRPDCPSDGEYSINKIGEEPVCTVAGHEL